MRIAETFYIHRPSWLHRADPRVKVFFVLAVWGILFVYNTLPASLTAVVVLHGLLFSAGIPLRKVGGIWKAMLPINLSILIVWLLFQPVGDVVWQFGWVRVTVQGLLQGAALALRIDALAFLLFTWLFTTDANALVRGFVRLGMPYPWGLVLTLVLHYIPSFQSQFYAILEAQQARGLRVEGKGFRRVRALMPVLVALVIQVLRTADQLAWTLEARCFGIKGVQRTFLHETRFRWADYGYLAVILGVTVLLFYLRLR
mgnify:CR=1 FL=1